MLVTPDLAKISGFALYGFIILNNDLSNAGYFITNDNREEKYLEILETGDEKLIQKLEDYLNYKDEIEAVAQLERKFATFRTEVRAAATPEEIVEIEQRFLERFYATF
jgi:chromatin segregation and condensation protein Rec8/ScpA/Scc1 (kleisin family)